ncbi:MAG: hypothetical protein SGCHY_001660 [Lobulomycetales sp.]
MRYAWSYLKYNIYNYPVIVSAYALSITGVGLVFVGIPLKYEYFKVQERPRPPRSYPNQASKTAMQAFKAVVNKIYSLDLSTYRDLHAWSVANYPEFWKQVWDFAQIKASVPYTRVLAPETASISDFPEWFPSARFNYAENLLCHGKDEQVAIISATEAGINCQITFKELKNRVNLFSRSLLKFNVGPGDRVCCFISNCVEAVVAMLGSLAIGATFSSASPDFGTVGVLERFKQIKPRVLVCSTQVLYNGKMYDQMGKVKEIIQGLAETVEHVVLIPGSKEINIDSLPVRTTMWPDFLSESDAEAGEPIPFAQLPASHPIFILFSSGTTGSPKCIVHGARLLLQHKKELLLHCDLKQAIFQVLFDGSPLMPHAGVLFDLARDVGLHVFGASAKYYATLEKQGYKAPQLLELRAILSTGSPLLPSSFDYIHTAIKDNIPIGSITGGTDICSLFAGIISSEPVYRGEIQGVCLGIDMQGWDESGKRVPDGQEGDLVVCKPFPAMPVSFWNDDENRTKYQRAYFSHYDGSVWYHGDFIRVNPATGGIVMQGRSDGTLNPSGVRFGSAELYNILEGKFPHFPELQDTLAVGQPIGKGEDERVVLFCKLNAGYAFDDGLVKRIKVEIRRLLSPRHVPAVILEIADIPYTLTGKKVEVAVKRILQNVSLFLLTVNTEAKYKHVRASQSREFKAVS